MLCVEDGRGLWGPTREGASQVRWGIPFNTTFFQSLSDATWRTNVIESAAQFVALRNSSDPAEYRRAAHEEALLGVWLEVVDSYPEMRVWVARNKTVPDEVLAVLATDTSAAVRHAVAMRRRLSDDTLRALVSDPDESVRYRVAIHRNATPEILRLLADDPWDKVRQAATDRLDTEGA